LNIQYVPYDEIDKTRWDRCLGNAANSLIYGYSFYLDHITRHWDALIGDDYDVVMPLTWNKKFGIHYLYQPAFAANLGLFGNTSDERLTGHFIESIPGKFKLVEISLNSKNTLRDCPFGVTRVNYFLPLQKDYEQLSHFYRENHHRNIQKASQAQCKLVTNVSVQEVISLNKAQIANKASIREDDYAKFSRLYEFLKKQNNALCYGITDRESRLLASAVFFVFGKRAYYILAGNHPDGRSIGASHTLIDAFIRHHAGQDLILDFEGSDIETLALFYSGFGAVRETYPAIRWNRLPWYLRWLKA